MSCNVGWAYRGYSLDTYLKMKYSPGMNDEAREPQLPVVREKEEQKHRMKEPSKYKVVMLNDDFTPMEWVVKLLVEYFGKSTEQANSIMMQVHKGGKGIAGVYTKDIAETKMTIANQASQANEFPFRMEIEPDA